MLSEANRPITGYIFLGFIFSFLSSPGESPDHPQAER
jgi:hypothetical protein